MIYKTVSSTGKTLLYDNYSLIIMNFLSFCPFTSICFITYFINTIYHDGVWKLTLSLKSTAAARPISENSHRVVIGDLPSARKMNLVGRATSLASAITIGGSSLQNAMIGSLRKSSWPTRTFATSVPSGSFFIIFLFGCCRSNENTDIRHSLLPHVLGYIPI